MQDTTADKDQEIGQHSQQDTRIKKNWKKNDQMRQPIKKLKIQDITNKGRDRRRQTYPMKDAVI